MGKINNNTVGQKQVDATIGRLYRMGNLTRQGVDILYSDKIISRTAYDELRVFERPPWMTANDGRMRIFN